jgi:hypothetical protein
MKALKLKVEAGRITGEAPPGMPDGEVDLCLAEPEDDMTDEELETLNRALEAGWRSLQAGRVRPAGEAVAQLRNRR